MVREGLKLYQFCESLTKLLVNSTQLFHLDISGMFIGDQGIRQILLEGVAPSKTLAAIHFRDNKVSHWLRLQIYYALKGKMRTEDPNGLLDE